MGMNSAMHVLVGIIPVQIKSHVILNMLLDSHSIFDRYGNPFNTLMEQVQT